MIKALTEAQRSLIAAALRAHAVTLRREAGVVSKRAQHSLFEQAAEAARLADDVDHATAVECTL